MASSSSPRHASFLESSNSPHRNHENTNPDLSSPAFPASGAGSPSMGPVPRGARSFSNSKQRRRLQLRNAGFRGPNLPGRRVTPANTSSTATTTTWSAGQTSDRENISPLNRKKQYGDEIGEESNWSMSRRNDSTVGVLQDIVNSAPVRRVRPRMPSAKFWTNEDTSELPVAVDDHNSTSPPPQLASLTTARPRSLRARANMFGYQSQLNREAREREEHIAWLEGSLNATLAQPDKMTSKQQSDRIRHLNAENQRLQAELREWEKNYQDRISEVTDEHRDNEARLRSQINSLESKLADKRRPIKDIYAATTEKWHFEKNESLESQLKSTKENLEKAEERIQDLQEQNYRLNALMYNPIASPAKREPVTGTSWRQQRGRPASLDVRVPTGSSWSMSPDRWSITGPPSPAFSRMRQSPGGPMSPLASTFSPEVASPNDTSNDSEASFGTTIVHADPYTFPQRERHPRVFRGKKAQPLLLAETSLPDLQRSQLQPLRSAPLSESSDGEPRFKFSPDQSADGSPHSRHRRSSTEAVAAPASRRPSGLRLDTTNTELDMDASLSLQSPSSPSFDDVNARTFSTNTIDSTIAKSIGRNLMEELTAARNFSNSTEPEPANSALGQTVGESTEDTMDTVIRGSPHSSPFDSEVEELPEENANSNNVTSAEQGSPRIAPSPSADVPVPSFIAERKYHCGPVMSHIIQHQSSSTSLAAPSQTSLSALSATSHSSHSTLDSMRTVLSNLFRSPIDVVKHLVQAAQSRMGIPRSLLSIQWWIVGVLWGPIMRRQMLRRSSSSASEQQSLLADSASNDQDVNALGYGTAYQTPQTSPYTVGLGSHSMVAGTGKKRASSPSTKNALVPSGNGAGPPAKHCPHQPRRWKHSPWLWLKFSMCLAVAVGVAFKEGPSSLLKEAVCEACKSKKGNWRKTSRDEPFTPPS